MRRKLTHSNFLIDDEVANLQGSPARLLRTEGVRDTPNRGGRQGCRLPPLLIYDLARVNALGGVLRSEDVFILDDMRG